MFNGLHECAQEISLLMDWSDTANSKLKISRDSKDEPCYPTLKAPGLGELGVFCFLTSKEALQTH